MAVPQRQQQTDSVVESLPFQLTYRKKKKVTQPFFLFSLGLMTAVTIFLLVNLAQFSIMLKTQFTLDKLNRTKAHLVKENKMLTLDVNSLSSLKRIEFIATKRLNMVQPQQRIIIREHKLKYPPKESKNLR